MTRDDERAARVKHEVVWRERGRHARAQRERLGARVALIEANLAQRRRRYGHLRAVRRDRHAIRKGDVRRDGGVRVRRRSGDTSVVLGE